MDPCKKVGGKTTKPMEKVDLSMLMEMFMMDNGLMIKLTDLEFIAILMEPNMKGTGKRTSNTETVWKPGQMVLDMKVNIFKERSTVMEDLLGQTEALIMESSLKIISKAKEYITGLIKENMMVHG